MPMTRLSAVLLSVLACGACAGAPASSAPAPSPAGADTTRAVATPAGGVLSGFVGQPLVVVPTQQLRVVVGAPAWAPAGPDARAYLAALDDEIAAALRDRGVAGRWVLAEQVVRSARRNPTLASDPHALSIDPLLPRGQSADRGGGAGAGTELRDPLSSQLRAITALSEDARYVLVPVELRFERAPATGGAGAAAPTAPSGPAGRAVLHLALVDTRAAQVRWAGDVASDEASSLSPAVAASLADRVANLAGPPR